MNNIEDITWCATIWKARISTARALGDEEDLSFVCSPILPNPDIHGTVAEMVDEINDGLKND